MGIDKGPEFWKKLGRNNKNRGRTFEKKVAAVLGWTRVPYSGGSGAWGEGDVVDGFYARTGKWFAECKTQPCSQGMNVSVRSKWIERCFKSANKETRLPVIITSLYGRSEAYVFLPRRSVFRWMFETKFELAADIRWHTKARGQGGFCVQGRWMNERKWEIAFLDVEGAKPGQQEWIIMKLEKFRQLIYRTDYFTKDKEPTDGGGSTDQY